MLVGNKELLLTDELVVKKANCLVQDCKYDGKFAGTAPSVLEHKLLECVMAALQNCSEFKPVQITAQEFWARLGAKDYTSGNYLKLFADAAIKLSTQKVFVPTAKPTINEPTMLNEYKKAVDLFTFVQVSRDQKESIFEFNPIVAPTYLNLKNHYYAYPLSESKNMTTKYGRLLFELLCSYKNLNKPIKFTFEDLAEKIDATKHLKRVPDFKRLVMESAVEDINAHCPNTSVTYTITKLKPGRYLVSFVMSADFFRVQEHSTKRVRNNLPQMERFDGNKLGEDCCIRETDELCSKRSAIVQRSCCCRCCCKCTWK